MVRIEGQGIPGPKRKRFLHTEFDIPDQAKQNIIALDITMDNAMPMKMLQTLAGLATNSGNLTFGHEISSNDIGQAAAFHILHDDPEVILPQETVNIVDDIGMTGGAHDENLIDDKVLFRLLVEVHLLDGDGHVSADLVGGVDASTGTLANFGEIAIEASRIGVGTNRLETLYNVLSISSILFPLPPARGGLCSGVLDLEFGDSRGRNCCGGCSTVTTSTTGRGALAGAGRLACGRSWGSARGLGDTRTGGSGVGGASFFLSGVGAFNIRDARIALTLCP
jgi:hypothetical protein